MAKLVIEPQTKLDVPLAEVINGEDDGVMIYQSAECCEKHSIGEKKRCCKNCLGCESQTFKEFLIEDRGKIIPIAPTLPRHGFIFGPTGCGKSDFCYKYASSYQESNPNNPVYLISYVDEDSTIDRIKDLIRIPMSDIIDGQITGKNLKNSLVIFDDVDSKPPVPEDKSYEPKELFKLIEDTRDAMLTTGRHDGISVLVTSHLGADALKTKKSINESGFIVVYPKAGAFQQIDRIMRIYNGLSKPQLKKLQELPSRWVMLQKSYPPLVIHEKGVYLL